MPLWYFRDLALFTIVLTSILIVFIYNKTILLQDSLVPQVDSSQFLDMTPNSGGLSLGLAF